MFLQATDSGERDDGANANGPESRDVGTVGNLRRGKFVMEAMAGEECYGGVVRRFEDCEGAAGGTVGCLNIEACDGLRRC